MARSKKDGKPVSLIMDKDLYARLEEYCDETYMTKTATIEKALKELLEYMISNYDADLFTTTYEWGNDHAKHIYEKVGFIEKAIVEEDGCKEVDMIYKVD